MLKAATGKIKITPTSDFEPIYLSGHAIRTYKSVGVLNDIYTEALLLEINSEQILFLSVELVGLEKEVTEKIISKISQKHSIKKENIIITFTHTHAAPENSLNTFVNNNKDSKADKYMD